MKIAVLKEREGGEKRVAATPDTVKKFIALGAEVFVENGAGSGSHIPDSEYEKVGAKLSHAAHDLKEADIVLKVHAPDETEIHNMKEGAIVVGVLNPYENKPLFEKYNAKKITSFSMELLPRTTRAQSMDVLSSQANLAGYRAVIDAAHVYGKAFPMMMTAAGTVAPARAVIFGAGVAGLQAIATAKRLGAIVSAFDVRSVVKEQVQSLGATFIEVPSDEKGDAAGGYAKEMSEDYQRRQRELIHETLKKQDIAITTAQIPGKRAPILITNDMVKDMKPGSVIVDLAAINGGNCEATKPAEVYTTPNGVTIIGHKNYPSRIAQDSSQLYAKNLLNFVSLFAGKEGIKINEEDDLIKGTMLTKGGETVHQAFK